MAQTITFPAPTATLITQSPVLATTTASSGLPVTFTTTTPDVCTAGGADGGTITLLDAGRCTVRAEQAGDAVYRAAPAVNRSFTVTKLANTITFPAMGTKTLAESPATAVASASSGLPVTFTTTTPDGAPPAVPTVARSRCSLPVGARFEQSNPATGVPSHHGQPQLHGDDGCADDHVPGHRQNHHDTVTDHGHSQRVEWPARDVHDHHTRRVHRRWCRRWPITLLDVGRCIVRAEQASDDYWRFTAINRGFTVTLPPPEVQTFDASPTLLGSDGGSGDLSGTATFADTCRFSVSPALAGFPLTVSSADAAAATTVVLPANTTANSRTYTIGFATLRPGPSTATAISIAVRWRRPASRSSTSPSAQVSADPAATGQPLTYSATVTNAGPNPAPDVDFSAALPAGAMFGRPRPPRVPAA